MPATGTRGPSGRRPRAQVWRVSTPACSDTIRPHRRARGATTSITSYPRPRCQRAEPSTTVPLGRRYRHPRRCRNLAAATHTWNTKMDCCNRRIFVPASLRPTYISPYHFVAHLPQLEDDDISSRFLSDEQGNLARYDTVAKIYNHILINDIYTCQRY